jgi:hypothetical protein
MVDFHNLLILRTFVYLIFSLFLLFFSLFQGWDTMFEALLRYGEENGTCNVPRKYICCLPKGTISPDNKPIEEANLGNNNIYSY